jgi:F-type H+-transporting ATPase subunit alpha
VIEQITILIALTTGLFDTVPLDRMKEAERSVQQAASTVPPEIQHRILGGDPLGSEDRKAILAVAANALVDYQESGG